MKAQIDQLDEYIMKKGHLFVCKLVDDAGFLCQTNSALRLPYLFAHTHTRDFATNSAKPINSLLSKLSNWSFCCCQLSFPCRMDETHLHPPRSPPAFFSFLFFLISNRIFGSFPLSSSTSFQIAPDSRPHQEDIFVNQKCTPPPPPAHLFNFSCRAQRVREIDLGGKSQVRNNPVQSAVHLSRRCSTVVTLRLCLGSNVMALIF